MSLPCPFPREEWGLDAGDDAALLLFPAFGRVAKVVEAPDFVGVRLGATDGCVLRECCDPAEQHAVAGEAENVADPVALQPGHGLGAGVVAVAADHDLDLRPTGADRLDQMPEDAGDLGTVGGLAGPEDHRHGLAGRGLVDVDRQKAAAVVVGVEQRQLLAPVHPVERVVDIEQDASRHLLEAVAEEVDHRSSVGDRSDPRSGAGQEAGEAQPSCG